MLCVPPKITRAIPPNTAHGILWVVPFILLCIAVRIAWSALAKLLDETIWPWLCTDPILIHHEDSPRHPMDARHGDAGREIRLPGLTTAEPEMVYPEGMTPGLTRPAGSGNPAQHSTGHSNPGSAPRASSSTNLTGPHFLHRARRGDPLSCTSRFAIFVEEKAGFHSRLLRKRCRGLRLETAGTLTLFA